MIEALLNLPSLNEKELKIKDKNENNELFLTLLEELKNNFNHQKNILDTSNQKQKSFEINSNEKFSVIKKQIISALEKNDIFTLKEEIKEIKNTKSFKDLISLLNKKGLNITKVKISSKKEKIIISKNIQIQDNKAIKTKILNLAKSQLQKNSVLTSVLKKDINSINKSNNQKNTSSKKFQKLQTNNSIALKNEIKTLKENNLVSNFKVNKKAHTLTNSNTSNEKTFTHTKLNFTNKNKSFSSKTSAISTSITNQIKKNYSNKTKNIPNYSKKDTQNIVLNDKSINHSTLNSSVQNNKTKSFTIFAKEPHNTVKYTDLDSNIKHTKTNNNFNSFEKNTNNNKLSTQFFKDKYNPKIVSSHPKTSQLSEDQNIVLNDKSINHSNLNLTNDKIINSLQNNNSLYSFHHKTFTKNSAHSINNSSQKNFKILSKTYVTKSNTNKNTQKILNENKSNYSFSEKNFINTKNNSVVDTLLKENDKNSLDIKSTTKQHIDFNNLFVINSQLQKPIIKKSITHLSSSLNEAIKEYKPPISKISIEMNPKELGKIEVTLIHRGENLEVKITSNTNNTLNFIQANQNELKQNLINMGYTNINMSFNSNSQQQRQQHQQKYKQHQEELEEIVLEIPNYKTFVYA